MPAQPLTLALPGGGTVSAIWQSPKAPRAALSLAHGAGAGMTHRAMTAVADGLERVGVATLRFQFPYMEAGGRRPDPPRVAHAAVRAAAAEALRRAGDVPLFAGGRSFGGRMTSQAQAQAALEGVRGLVFFAFPLHPAGRPGTERADHLDAVSVPMLFLQGTKDMLAEIGLLRGVATSLGERASLVQAQDADHAFHVPARSGRKDPEVLAELLSATAAWMDRIAST